MVGVNEDDVLYVRYFGEYCNPFHIMYDFNIADKEFEELVDIPDKESDLYKYMYKTYLEARKMTNLPKNIKNKQKGYAKSRTKVFLNVHSFPFVTSTDGCVLAIF